MTIEDLIAGKTPGSIKIKKANWENGKYIVPYFYDERLKSWYGLENKAGVCVGEAPDWMLYE